MLDLMNLIELQTQLIRELAELHIEFVRAERSIPTTDTEIHYYDSLHDEFVQKAKDIADVQIQLDKIVGYLQETRH